MTRKYTHEDLLRACRDRNHEALLSAIESGLPMNGHALESTPLWVLAESIGEEVRNNDGILPDDLIQCFSWINESDITEHDSAAVKRIIQQLDIYETELIHWVPSKHKLHYVSLTDKDSQARYLTKLGYPDEFICLIDEHLAGKYELSSDVLRESIYNIARYCANFSENTAIQMASKLIGNGLGLRDDTDIRWTSHNESMKYVFLYSVIYHNRRELLKLFIDSGELAGIGLEDEEEIRSWIEELYTEPECELQGEHGALSHLLKSMTENELHHLSQNEVMVGYDEAARIKHLILSKSQESVTKHKRLRSPL